MFNTVQIFQSHFIHTQANKYFKVKLPNDLQMYIDISGNQDIWQINSITKKHLLTKQLLMWLKGN